MSAVCCHKAAGNNTGAGSHEEAAFRWEVVLKRRNTGLPSKEQTDFLQMEEQRPAGRALQAGGGWLAQEREHSVRLGNSTKAGLRTGSELSWSLT